MSKYQTATRLTERDEEGKYEQVQFKSTELLPGAVIGNAAEAMEGA